MYHDFLGGIVMHAIYEADKAIAACLRSILLRELGEAFLRWDNALEEARERAYALTLERSNVMAKSTLDSRIELQEDLLSENVIYPPVNKALLALISQATPAQATLIELYSCVLSEQHDLERMELAVQIAESTKNDIYIAKVKRIMGLDEISDFTWWRG